MTEENTYVNPTTGDRSCKACRLERQRRFYSDRPNYQKERYREDPQRHSDYSRRWRHKGNNLERVRENSRRWARENPERHHRRYSDWAKNNPDKRRAKEHRRRARELSQLGPWLLPEPEFMRLLWFAQQGRCYYCLDPLDETAHQDHKIPLSRGGMHSSENVCWSCARCNQSKKGRTTEEFMEVRHSSVV